MSNPYKLHEVTFRSDENDQTFSVSAYGTVYESAQETLAKLTKVTAERDALRELARKDYSRLKWAVANGKRISIAEKRQLLEYKKMLTDDQPC
jgi:hypothetical protein